MIDTDYASKQDDQVCPLRRVFISQSTLKENESLTIRDYLLQEFDSRCKEAAAGADGGQLFLFGKCFSAYLDFLFHSMPIRVIGRPIVI